MDAIQSVKISGAYADEFLPCPMSMLFFTMLLSLSFLVLSQYMADGSFPSTHQRSLTVVGVIDLSVVRPDLDRSEKHRCRPPCCSCVTTH